MANLSGTFSQPRWRAAEHAVSTTTAPVSELSSLTSVVTNDSQRRKPYIRFPYGPPVWIELEDIRSVEPLGAGPTAECKQRCDNACASKKCTTGFCNSSTCECTRCKT